MPPSRTFVIAVSGTSGSGRSTLVRGLVESLSLVGHGSVGRCFFDDYTRVSDLPEGRPGRLAAPGRRPGRRLQDAADLLDAALVEVSAARSPSR